MGHKTDSLQVKAFQAKRSRLEDLLKEALALSDERSCFYISEIQQDILLLRSELRRWARAESMWGYLGKYPPGTRARRNKVADLVRQRRTGLCLDAGLIDKTGLIV